MATIVKSNKNVIAANVPITIEAPEQMLYAIKEVFAGEYEPGYFGEELNILDLGANVGSFSLWANLRWPRSIVYAYEPHPGTFAILKRNTASFDNIRPVNAAVFPTETERVLYFGRFDGDGEAGVADCMTATFSHLDSENTFSVSALHPRELPPADIIKVDVEGAEVGILKNMNLSAAALILVEYQNDANRADIKDILKEQFVLEFEDEFAWDDLLSHKEYRADLAGNHWGRMFFVRREQDKLQRLARPRSHLEPIKPKSERKSWRDFVHRLAVRLRP